MEKVCIVCPMGCNLLIEKDKNEESGYRVTGNRCNRGKEYAIREVTNPVRVVTSTVKIKNHTNMMLPVKTNGPIPKDKIFPIMDKIKSIEVSLPVKKNDIVLQNICDTKVDLIATKSIVS
jgi:CxxC motif-containing protein